MYEKNVDVFINVFGKPYQTALALLSLLRWSGGRIDKIFFHEEPGTSEFERRNHAPILEFLKDRIVHFPVPRWLGTNTTDEKRLPEDEVYRLSMRYQYGWENTSKKYALIIHNDIEVTADVVSELLKTISSSHTAAGEIGQCWWCPAMQHGLCSPERYESYKPKYHQLMYIYNTGMDYKNRRAYNLGLRPEFWEKPWPLPECRVNEWCMLVDMEKARPATQPFGPAAPLGACFASGAKIGENWDEDVNLDTGVQWFRDLSHMGHKFAHYPIERCIRHDRQGNLALNHAELYVKNEMLAKQTLQREYPDFYRVLK